jgi:hypothetical protein
VVGGADHVHSWIYGPPPSSGRGSSPASGSSSPSGGGGSPSSGGGGAPPWARRMSQSLRTTGQAIRSGDRAGAPTAVKLRGEDR